MGSITLITDVATEPVTLAEAKSQSRIDGSEDDELLAGLIAAARKHIENMTGYVIGTQTLLMSLDAFPAGDIKLMRTPIVSVTSIVYTDTDSDSQTVPADDYVVDTSRSQGKVSLAYGSTWPVALAQINTVLVTFVAGDTVVPAPLKQAIKLLVGHWYEQREDTSQSGSALSGIPNGMEALIAPYQVY